jgi:hypothetical protein
MARSLLSRRAYTDDLVLDLKEQEEGEDGEERGGGRGEISHDDMPGCANG